MFAGVAVAWLVFLVPWFASRSDGPLEDEADPQSARFSDSMRILRQDVLDQAGEKAEVSTPLMRRAELAQLKMIAKTAAKRRRIVLLVLLTGLTGLTLGWALGSVPWWTMLIPVGLIVAFLGIARFSVVAMHRSLDERARRIVAGWDSEDTDVIVLADDEESIRLELSMDLATESLSHGSLWDPIPVTAATYVSQPLAPRTVRTIDLSAPQPAKAVVPTADALEDTQGFNFETGEQRPRAVNE